MTTLAHALEFRKTPSASGADPLLRPGTRICLCRNCNQYLASPSTFDAHRTGPYAPYTDRRCYTESELREKGFTTNSQGFWRRVEPYVKAVDK